MPSAPSRLPVMAIRLIGLAILVCIAAFPPWQLTYSLNGQKQAKPAGYRPIWDPPADEIDVADGATDPGYRINVVRLTIQLVVVLGLMNAGIYLARKAEK